MKPFLAKFAEKTLEILWISHYHQNNADVKFLNNPSNDLEIMLAEASELPPENHEN